MLWLNAAILRAVMLSVCLKNIFHCEATLLKLSRSASQNVTPSKLLNKELYFDDKIVRLILNDSKKRNALSIEMIEALQEELEYITTAKKHHAVILAAKGPAFSSGHDLKQLKWEVGAQKLQETFEKCAKMMLLIQNMDIPVIAEVNGIAAAAGCQLVASCDVVVAGRSSKFAVPGAKVGLFCSTPGIAIARTMSRKVALDMLFTGDFIDAQKAFSSGLVSRVVEDSKVKEEALDIAGKVASLSRPVLAIGKKFFYSQVELPVHAAYRMATPVMVGNLKLKDSQEGIAAFIEKRKPVWTNTEKPVD